MNELAIVILSCDKYADLWDGFFHQLNKTFPTGLKKYLVSNHLDYPTNEVSNLTVIKNGDDTNWSGNLLKVLSVIPENKIFIILEDIYIDSKVDLVAFGEMQKFLFDTDAQHIKYMANPKATLPINTKFCAYEIGMPYLVSACGIWDKNYLSTLLIDGENAWDFEVNASYRAKYSAKTFFAPKKPLFTYKNMVEKGVWIKSSLDWALAADIPIQVDFREIRNPMIFESKRIIFNAVSLVPWRLRMRFGNLLKKLLIFY